MRSSRFSSVTHRIACLGLFFGVTILSTPYASADMSKDRALLAALADKNIEAAREALEAGADPEAIIGGDLEHHAVCKAIDDSSSRFLELLVEYGASPNAYFDVDRSSRRTPLACSVDLLNFSAFDYLLANGADPSVDLSPELSSEGSVSRTAFIMALSGSRYPMALELISRYEPHAEDINRLKWNLERYPYKEAHPWNYAREALIAMTYEFVSDFNPKPAKPSPTGVSKECLFTFRDHEEGRKTGSICPRPEDLKG